MNPGPVVSVIINCLNAERYLREAIDSVYAQTFEDWEIVLWDNGSTDSTPAIARSYDGRLRYFSTQDTVLLGAARNRALAECKGDYVTFLDSDDLWMPEKLASQVAVFRQHPEVDFVYTNYETLDPAGRRRKVLRGPQPSGEVFAAFLRRYRVGLVTVGLRRSAIGPHGPWFDETLQFAEEFDFFLRFLRRARAVYIPKVLAAYRIHHAMLSLRLGVTTLEEARYVLEKVARLDRMSAEEEAALAFARRKLSFEQALQALVYGRMRAARAILADDKWLDKKNLALYLITFLPSPVWMALRPLWERGTFRAR